MRIYYIFLWKVLYRKKKQGGAVIRISFNWKKKKVIIEKSVL